MSNPTPAIPHDIFISYRRTGGDVLSRLLYESLKHERYSVFFDYESLSSGIFGEKILAAIRNAKDVIVVLSKDCLPRCKENNDWMYREIAEAVHTGRNIIPIFSEDFVQPSPQELQEYPPEIEELLKHQGHSINIEHYDNIIKKLRAELKSQPLSMGDTQIKNTYSLLLNGGLDRLSDTEQNALMKQITASRYGMKLADIIADFLEKNLSYYKSVRTRFRYEITIDTGFDFRDIDVEEDHYFRLTEMLSYQKHLLNETLLQDFWISFIRDLDRLDDHLKNEAFIFSENLLMEKDDLEKLSALSEEEQMRFYQKSMRVHLNINGYVLAPTKLIINESGIFVNYSIQGLDIAEKQSILDVKLTFSIPYRKASSYFFVSISDPTYSPYIRFVYPEDDFDVEMIPFLNRNTTASDTRIFDGLIEVSFEKEWILPMSGIIFMLTPREGQ